MSDKQRFDLEFAKGWANWLKTYFNECCDRIEIAGSIRRRKPDVGDIEIVYVSKTEIVPDPEDLFGESSQPVIDRAIKQLEESGQLERRLNVNGSAIFGPKNKLMRLTQCGIPVDLFSATEENWFNYLVCRTGPGDSNVRIAQLAKQLGYKWKPYGQGFVKGEAIPRVVPMRSEEAVFDFVNLKYKEPWER